MWRIGAVMETSGQNQRVRMIVHRMIKPCCGGFCVIIRSVELQPHHSLPCQFLCTEIICILASVECVPAVSDCRCSVTACSGGGVWSDVLWWRNIAQFPYTWAHIGPLQSVLCTSVQIRGTNEHHSNEQVRKKQPTAYGKSLNPQRMLQNVQLADLLPSSGAAQKKTHLNMDRIIYECLILQPWNTFFKMIITNIHYMTQDSSSVDTIQVICKFK